MKNFTRGLLASAFLVSACETNSEFAVTRDRILGGDLTQIGDFPTVVAVLNSGLCTGTLIAPKVVLTAAHCVAPQVTGFANDTQVAANTIVVFDSVDVDNFNQGFAVGVDKTVRNAAFVNESDLGDNDIALIFLDAQIGRTPSPINLTAKNFIGDRVTMVGYGVSDQNPAAGLEVVLEDKLVSSCGADDDILICYDQTNGSGKCNGDSGGPTFDEDGVVIGVTSFGDPGCVQFGADTNTAGEKDFLIDTINANADLACGADGFDFPPCAADADRAAPADEDEGRCSVSPTSSTGSTSILALLGSFFAGLFLIRRRRS